MGGMPPSVAQWRRQQAELLYQNPFRTIMPDLGSSGSKFAVLLMIGMKQNKSAVLL